MVRRSVTLTERLPYLCLFVYVECHSIGIILTLERSKQMMTFDSEEIKCNLINVYFALSGAYSALLRELVAEFTLTDNAANTTTSMLRSMCHADDSVILGSWLQETDHKAIEDQVRTATTQRYTQSAARIFC